MKKLLFFLLSIFAVQVAMADEVIASYTFPNEDLAAVDEVDYKATAITADPYTAKGTFVNCSISLKKVGGYSSGTKDSSTSGSRNAYINDGIYYHKLSGNDAYIRFALASGTLNAGDVLTIVVWCNTTSTEQGISFGHGTESSIADAKIDIPAVKAEQTLKYTLTAEDIHDGSIYIYRQSGKSNFGIKSIWINCEESKEVSIGSTGYATFSGAIDYAVPTGCEAFVASSFADDVITISKIENGIIPANTGVLLKGAEGTYTLTAQAAAATVGTNLFKANVTASELSETDGDYTNFILVSDGEGGVKFAKVSGGTLGAYKSYLQLPTASQAGARRLSIVFYEGETTGISAALMNNERMNNEVYNLAGQRVAQPTKGLYIVNGKKYIVK